MSRRVSTFAGVMLSLAMSAGCSGPVGGTAEENGAGPVATVEVVVPRREAVVRTIGLSATVEAYETAPIYAKVAGYLKTISVDIGDRVSEGQELATLEIPEMAEQYNQAEGELGVRRAELAKAEAEARLRTIVFQRSRELRERDAITQQDLDEARAHHSVAEAELRLTRARQQSAEGRLAELGALMDYGRLKAPFDGIVTERFVDRGALVQAATSSTNMSPVVTVARTDVVRVFVDVPEPDVPFIDRGDPAVLELSALPGRPFKGRVARFAGALDPRSRTMRTEADFPNPAGELLPGMYGTLTISIDTREGALTLPQKAVRRRKQAAFAYVVQGTRAARRQLQTGIVSGDRVEILDGIADTDRVIVVSHGNLSDGGEVRVVAGTDRLADDGA